jgi:hypothetical protein
LSWRATFLFKHLHKEQSRKVWLYLLGHIGHCCCCHNPNSLTKKLWYQDPWADSTTWDSFSLILTKLSIICRKFTIL